MPLLSELSFAALLQYSVRGKSDVSERSREVRNGIKRGVDPILRRSVEVLCERVDEGMFRGLFGPDVILVPVPKSARLLSGALWVPRELGQLLVEAALGRDVHPLLERHTAVPKAASQKIAENRPTPQEHFETIRVSMQLPIGPRVTLIDDVVTSGATLLGSASRLAADTHYDVRAFAFMRAISEGEIDDIVSPCSGTITLKRDGRTLRRP